MLDGYPYAKWKFIKAWNYAHCPYYSIRHWWRVLWVRKDEFHISLEIDMEWLTYCNPKGGLDAHLTDVTRRRQIAHERDMNYE